MPASRYILQSIEANAHLVNHDLSEKADKKYEFKIGETILNHVTCYNYLGLTISASGQFNTAIKDLTDKARRAFYSIRRPLIKFNPPIKLWIKIFHSIIKPILLYGCEIWGLKFKLNYESWDKNPVEIFHLEFCKHTPRVTPCTI